MGSNARHCGQAHTLVALSPLPPRGRCRRSPGTSRPHRPRAMRADRTPLPSTRRSTRLPPPPPFLHHEATHRIPFSRPPELSALPPFVTLSTPSSSSPTACPCGPQVRRRRRPPGTPSPLNELHPLGSFVVDWASLHPLSSPS
jgi:hypothetical protein